MVAYFPAITIITLSYIILKSDNEISLHKKKAFTDWDQSSENNCRVSKYLRFYYRTNKYLSNEINTQLGF